MLKNKILLFFIILAIGSGCNSNAPESANTVLKSPNIIDTSKYVQPSKTDLDGDGVPNNLDAFPDDKSKSGPAIEAKFGSYLGGRNFDRIQAVFIDNKGYIYLGGHTSSPDFPVTDGVFDTRKKGPTGNGANTQDGFVVKLSADGTRVIWSTILGGTRRDQIYAIRTDSHDNVYILGATGSDDFPTTPGAYDQTFNGPTVRNGLTDIFVASLSPDGKKLRFSTYIGGTQGKEENPRGALLIDEKHGRIFVSGQTSAPDFPTTPGAFQRKYGGGSEDAFVFALSLDGSKLIASSFIGGSGSDSAFTGIALHPSGDSLYMAGTTNSTDFPISTGAFQPGLASGKPKQHWWESGDAFITRISASLDKIIFSTYYGGSGPDTVSHNQGLTTDSQGHVVVIGQTGSPDLPISKGAFDTTYKNNQNGFAAIFSEKGQLLHATYIDEAYVAGVKVDLHGRIYLTGSTGSNTFKTTPDAYQASFGSRKSSAKDTDAFLTVFDAQLKHIVYSTYLGGTLSDIGRAMWIAPTGKAVIGGLTNSSDFPFPGKSLQTTLSGKRDAFFMVFDQKKSQ